MFKSSNWPLAALTMLLFLCIACLLRSCSTKLAIQNQLLASQDSTRYWKNEAGKQIAARKAVEVSSFTKEDPSVKELDIKPAQILSYAKIASSATLVLKPSAPVVLGPAASHHGIYFDSGSPRIAVGAATLDDAGSIVDSNRSMRSQECPSWMQQDFSSPYYQVKVRVGDSAYAQVSRTDTISIANVSNYSRSGLFGLKKNWFHELRAVSADPDANLSLLKAATITERPDPWLVIGVSLGAGFSVGDITKGHTFAGVTATVPLIKFRIRR